MAIFGCMSLIAASNLILFITGALSLPLYFSFYGSEAAVRLSLLLSMHSCLLAAVPSVLKSMLPMLQLVLFAGLLLLPFNATPFLLVWCYQKLLLLSEPAFLIIEALEIVLVAMYISQSFVNEIDEQPVMVKSCILAISGVSYLLSLFLSYRLLTDIHTASLETWVAGFAVILSVLVFFVCIYKEEGKKCVISFFFITGSVLGITGIISDAAVVSSVMMFIVWAMKQERLMEENSLDAPSQWLQSFNHNRSFLNMFLSMATVSMEHLSRVQRIISIFVSPTCFLFASVRVASVVGFVFLTQMFYSHEEEEHCSMYIVEPKPNREILRPLYIRLIIIFVYTQVLVRTIDSTIAYNVHDLGNRASSVELFPFVTGVRVWRIVQLFIVTGTYLNRLFKQFD